MALTRTENQVKWSTANFKSVTTLTGEESDVVTLDDTCVSASITCKAKHSGTAGADDTMEFWVLASSGDTDTDPTVTYEYPTDANDGQFLCLCDTNATDPYIKTVPLPVVPKRLTIYAYNNAGESMTASCTIEELRSG